LSTGLIALTIVGGVAFGQADALIPSSSTLDKGTLTVWVTQRIPTRMTAPVVLDKTVHQQSVGSFGQSASSVGKSASNHGQSAGSFGQSTSNYGTSANNYGQSSASFGHSLDTIADAGGLDAQAMQGSAKIPAKVAMASPDPYRDRLRAELKRSFYDLKANFVTVAADQLQEKLAAAEGQAGYPDVIVGDPLPAEWQNIAKDAGVVMVGSPGVIEQEANQIAQMSNTWQAVILLRAPHPDAAKAFVVWLREAGWDSRQLRLIKSDAREATNAATTAIEDLLGGTKIAEADPLSADFSSALTLWAVLEAPPPIMAELTFHTDVLRAVANERFAVVALRVVASSERAFGVIHPLVVLRRVDGGRWKVLQISPNLAFDLQAHAFDRLRSYAVRVGPEHLAHVAGISQAAPLDGDYRPLVPDMWWDNGDGGSLLIVEWQLRYGSSWSDSKMYLIPDIAPRLQTRVTALFANVPGAYHWRVWMLGTGGALTISPWRTMNIALR
jgi:hypothetical protein